MLYAQIDKRRWDDVPAQWDKARDMFQYLNRMTWGYQLNIARRVLYSTIDPEYKCSLIKWVDTRDSRKREVLLETTDPAQMEATLFMLINEAEAEHKAMKDRMQQMSIVP